MKFQKDMAMRRAGLKPSGTDADQPLTNVGSVDFIAKKYVKKSKGKTVIEIKKL